MNRNMTSKKLASTASSVMRSKNSSKIQKSLAGSALSQRNSKNVTGRGMEVKASKVLNSSKYSVTTKRLAASVLSQSDTSR